MHLSRSAATTCFVLLAGLWYFAFLNDLGNFWHGGTAAGMILAEAAGVLGMLALLEMLRSNAHLALKISAGIIATPIAIAVVVSIVYAGKYLLAV